MRYYVTVPGIFHADCTMVQSEEMKKTYLTKIACFTNATVRKKMRKKYSAQVPVSMGREKDRERMPCFRS